MTILELEGERMSYCVFVSRQIAEKHIPYSRHFQGGKFRGFVVEHPRNTQYWDVVQIRSDHKFYQEPAKCWTSTKFLPLEYITIWYLEQS